MITEQIIDILNKEFGYEIKSDYYTHISEWTDWWKGYRKEFHEFHEKCNGRRIDRQLYSLRMAKKVCEDWASILLNEKTQINADDEKSKLWLVGDDKSNGFLQRIGFWVNANRLVEKAFYSGTGAIVVSVDNMLIESGNIAADESAKIKYDYISADGIIPLTVENGNITEAAFVSEKTIKSKSYAYVQIITKSGGQYSIENRMYLIEEGMLKPVELPEGVLPNLTLNTDIPPFVIIEPNAENTFAYSQGLGMSIYANAIDCLKGVDLAFNNFCRDFKLGGKKVFMAKSMLQVDENGMTITPDDVAQQLFAVTEDEMREDGQAYIKEYNPELRVTENKDGVQSQLDYLSFKCGLGTKHYQFNGGNVVTATQYMGDKQELVQNAAKHYIIVENALITLMKHTLWVAKNICNADVNPDCNVSIQFEDSYIIDKESERLRDLQEVNAGLMQKWEYRVKWYGDDEQTAKAVLSESAPGGLSFNNDNTGDE